MIQQKTFNTCSSDLDVSEMYYFSFFSLICSPALGLNIARDVYSTTFLHQYVFNISSWKSNGGAGVVYGGTSLWLVLFKVRVKLN